jgi:hypothetical protein
MNVAARAVAIESTIDTCRPEAEPRSGWRYVRAFRLGRSPSGHEGGERCAVEPAEVKPRTVNDSARAFQKVALLAQHSVLLAQFVELFAQSLLHLFKQVSVLPRA